MSNEGVPIYPKTAEKLAGINEGMHESAIALIQWTEEFALRGPMDDTIRSAAIEVLDALQNVVERARELYDMVRRIEHE